MTFENTDNKKPSFHKGSIEYPIGRGSRGIEEYSQQLGFNPKELEGKSVLNLGAGRDFKFEKELQDSGISADVISMSPDWATDIHRKQAVENMGPNEKAVAGIGQALPFADGSFDIIVASHVIYYLKDPQTVSTFIKEIARVLRPGGKAFIGPTRDKFNFASLTFYEDILSDPDVRASIEAGDISFREERLSEGTPYSAVKVVDEATGIAMMKVPNTRFILEKK